MRRRTSAKKALTAKANQTKIANSKVSFEIESIDKQLATDYLATNFENNRKVRSSSVSKIVEDIKDGNFHLSWDCLAFNEEGQLVNGQHRLSAVIEADIPCLFYVLRNIDHSTVKHFDIGNKRSQADRISVHGTPMHPKACAVIKAMFGEWDANFTGSSKFANAKYDDIIASYYSRHSEYFEQLEADGYFKAKYIGNYVAAAFKIFLPTCPPPVKNIWSKDLFIRTSATEPLPSKTLTTSFGKCLGMILFINFDVFGAFSEGLSTAVFPAANALING